MAISSTVSRSARHQDGLWLASFFWYVPSHIRRAVVLMSRLAQFNVILHQTDGTQC